MKIDMSNLEKMLAVISLGTLAIMPMIPGEYAKTLFADRVACLGAVMGFAVSYQTRKTVEERENRYRL